MVARTARVQLQNDARSSKLQSREPLRRVFALGRSNLTSCGVIASIQGMSADNVYVPKVLLNLTLDEPALQFQLSFVGVILP